MRSEDEMIEMIISIARQCEKIRAGILNGSRACETAKKDSFCDYDVIYLTNDLDYFIADRGWVDRFGERIMLEMPWFKDFEPEDYGGRFNYQMLLADGNRIDLTFASLEKADFVVKNDPVGIVLLDKDGIFEGKEFASDGYFNAKPLPEREFENICNSFWWIQQNIAKGILRRELPYAMQMLNIARADLDRIVSCYIGLGHEFKVSTGKMGKYFQQFLCEEDWQRYKDTYPAPSYGEMWESMFVAGELFRDLSVRISIHFGYEYPYHDDRAMTDYLMELRARSEEGAS